jgi:alanine-synthesizing transaminase
LLEQADVAVSPGAGFGVAGEGYVRLAMVENENRLKQAVRQIQRVFGSELKLSVDSDSDDSHSQEIV